MLFCTQYAQKVIVGNDKGEKKFCSLYWIGTFLKKDIQHQFTHVFMSGNNICECVHENRMNNKANIHQPTHWFFAG